MVSIEIWVGLKMFPEERPKLAAALRGRRGQIRIGTSIATRKDRSFNFAIFFFERELEAGKVFFCCSLVLECGLLVFYICEEALSEVHEKYLDFDAHGKVYLDSEAQSSGAHEKILESET